MRSAIKHHANKKDGQKQLLMREMEALDQHFFMVFIFYCLYIYYCIFKKKK